MTLTQLYDEAMAEIRQQAREEGREEGEKQATVRLIENLFRVRFGEIDAALTEIIEPILKLSSEEFTPLLLQLSREDLIDRFQQQEETEEE